MRETTSTWLTPRHVAEMTGFSPSFIRAEISTGALRATYARSPARPRRRGRWRIAIADARDYCRRLGFSGQP